MQFTTTISVGGKKGGKCSVCTGNFQKDTQETQP